MTLINDFMSLIYPRHCEACGANLHKHEPFVCNYCLISLPETNYHQLKENELHRLLAGRIPLQNALCLYTFEKSGRVQKLLHAIKYEGQQGLAAFLGKTYATTLAGHEGVNTIDYIIPVPLHQKKLQLRGFNQSERFAAGLSNHLGIQLENNVLVRTTETQTQTRKRKYERWENVEGIFELTDVSRLKNKHVLLVDDVVTTGATLEAAWNCLKQAEGIKLSIAAIAFAKKS